MTNEEAKEILAIYRFNLIQSMSNQLEGDIEALDMAIKALEQQPCEDAISREQAVYIASGYCAPQNIADELRKLPSITPKVRWIPVSERLPEEQITIGKYIFSENVLGTEGFTIRRAYYNYTTKEWFDGNEETEWTEITHWMPLPEEPYKAESEVQ